VSGACAKLPSFRSPVEPIMASPGLSSPRKVFLYADRLPENASAAQVADRLRHHFRRSEISLRGEFILHHSASLEAGERDRSILELAEKLAAIRVRDPEKECSFREPVYGEIQYEKRRITDSGVKAHGILYDGFELARILGRLIPREERSSRHAHIVMSNQLFGTWGDDRRYHYRVSVYSVPCLISTTGIVEAPARPREYYLEKQSLAAAGLRDGSLEVLKRKYAGQFIDYDDERMTEVLVGYAMQAIVYAATGNPFCSEPNCRFFDAHHQKDLIRAQLGGDQFCQHHRDLLQRLNRGCGEEGR